MRIGHVIYLSSSGCSLFSWHHSCFLESPVRTPPGADIAPVVDMLVQLYCGPIAVLVDVLDEEHSRDVVARLGRRDQQAMLARKLARSFPRTPYRTAEIQGRSTENPDENRVLLSALTKPEQLRALLARLEEARLPLAGVISPALLAKRLLPGDAANSPAIMLVTRQSDGSLRHSFFRKGYLAGSRLVRQSAVSIADDAIRLVRQLEESLRYFDPAFSVSATSPLEVLLSADGAGAVPAASGIPDGWQLRPLDWAGLCRQLRVAVRIDAGHAERLFVELVGRLGVTENFATARDQRYYRLFRFRTYAKAACVLLVVAGFFGSALNGLFIADARSRLVDATATVGQLESLLAGGGEPATGMDPIAMRRVVFAYEALLQHEVDPAAILATVGAAVSQCPRIQIEAIQWSAGRPLASSAEPTTSPDRVTITVKGHVEPFAGDYPLAFDELEAFMQALRQNPAVQAVTPKAQPLNVSPAATLSGEVSSAARNARAPFTVEVVMRPNHERTRAGVARVAGR